MRTVTLTRNVATTVAFLATLTFGTGSAFAQTEGTSALASGAANAAALDARWLPWLDCWHLWEEQRGVPGRETAEVAAFEEEGPDAVVGRTLVCVTPSVTSSGIELTAASGDRILVERTLVADGNRHDVNEPGCTGWEQNQWSRDGQRLFMQAELQCGDLPKRSVQGVSVMASRSNWTDIQLVAVGARQHLEIRRYTPATAEQHEELLGPTFALPIDPIEIRQARALSAEPLTITDVLEAYEQTSTRIVEALLVETEPRLNLDSDALIELDETGVDGSVIDLMVALAYPEHFTIERRDSRGAWSSGRFGGNLYNPIWYGALYPYYVTPFGSTYWTNGYYPYLIGGASGPFAAVITAEEIDVPSGRAVNEHGYTRVVRVGPVMSSGVTASGRRAKRRGSDSESNTAIPSDGSSGGTAVASPGGYSRGRSGQDSGRSATPRQP